MPVFRQVDNAGVSSVRSFYTELETLLSSLLQARKKPSPELF